MKRPNWITRLIFPDKCLLCGKLLQTPGIYLCPKCLAGTPEALKLRQKIPFLSGAFALWYYEGAVRISILRYKFRRRRGYARDYGITLAGKLAEFQKQYDLITWVPVSSLRKLKRGFDQVELVARILCKELGVPPVPCLKKIRHTPPQSGIASAAQRRANVLGAYRPVNGDRICGMRILLVDDILTTGATLGECARELLTAGAKEIHCAVVASAHHNNPK